MNDTAFVKVQVILAETQRCQKVALAVSKGTTARDTLRLAVLSGLDLESLNIDPESAPLGVYALKVRDDYLMNEGDRLEVYRALAQDPMELRRKRALQDARRKKNKR